jgi:hypothetical protein
MKNILVPVALVLLGGVVSAKLPPLDDAAKAKAAEAAAKAAWQAKIDAYQLCKAQDRVAALYTKNSGKQANKDSAAVQPVSTAATAAASAPVKATSAPAAAASASPGTPVAAAAPPPCADPGPFAYNAPEQKPLETSGAHSPSGTAASPPSVKPNSREMTPGR